MHNPQMQVINGAGTAQLIWVGKWRGHMATHAATKMPTTTIYGILMLSESHKTLMTGEGRGYLTPILKMENAE